MSQIADRAGNSDGTGGSSPARSTRVRRNCPWTEAEHRLFLLGLEKYGRGSWRNIAAEFVTTRTATQVASHAQKYFLRDSAANQIRKRQRPSIHDIRSSSSVPSTQLEQEQLKCSLQRINKQSMELEMNAASDFHGGAAFGYPPGAQAQLNAAAVEDPSQNAALQGHNPLAQDRGPAQNFWPPGQSESQILAQNVLRGLLNSPFQLADLAQGHNDVTAGNNPRAQQFPPHAVTAPAAGAPTSFPSDVFGDVNELGGANSAMSPRAYALSGRHLTSDPNPMGTFSRQSPGAMGHPGTPPALAAQSALLRQQLHAAALNGETSAASGHQQRPWSVADMATSLGLDQLYSHGDRKLQDNADAMYAGADRPHSDPNAAQLSAAQGMRGNPGGLSQHMYSQAQQAVAHLAGKDRPSQRVSMGGEEPSNSGAGGLSAQHLQQLPQSAQAAYGVSGAPHSAPIDPTQAGAAGNDPFLQLLQGLKVAKALQGGGGDPEEAQQQDSHYRALVQMLAHRNAQMPQQQQRRPAGSPGEAGGGMNGIVSAPAVPHHSTGAPDTVMGASSHSLSGAYDGRVNPGRPGSVAGLEDMHALASLVAHSAGMPSAPDGGSQPGYLPGGLGGGAEGMGGGVLEGQAGLNGGGKPDQHQQPTDMGIPNMMNTNVPMDASAAPHGFNGGSGSTWDVSDKQMQDIAPQFQEALSRLHASAPAVSQWPLSGAPHASNA